MNFVINFVEFYVELVVFMWKKLEVRSLTLLLKRKKVGSGKVGINLTKSRYFKKKISQS